MNPIIGNFSGRKTVDLDNQKKQTNLCSVRHNSIQCAVFIKQDVPYFWAKNIRCRVLFFPANHMYCANKILNKHFQTSPCQTKQRFVSRLIRETGGALDRKNNRWSTVLREGTRKTQGSVSCNPRLNYWETSIIKFRFVSKWTPCIFLSRPKINTSYRTLAMQMEPQDLWKKKRLRRI